MSCAENTGADHFTIQKIELGADEQQQKERFEAFYSRSQDPVMVNIERRVCGCDYGGNSWTTRDEADEIISLLKLHTGTRLLDLGAGAGWPALYMAGESGCHATLVDLPANSLQIARERARKDNIHQQVTTIMADAAHLPVSDNCFDAITHSDLLCCLPNKQAVLKSCRRVIDQNGLMVFTVILTASNLSDEDYRRALDNGPEYIKSKNSYREMLNKTGWQITECKDLTAGFAASCKRQIEADQMQAQELTDLIGKDEYRQRTQSWQTKIAAINDGILCRYMYVAKPSNL